MLNKKLLKESIMRGVKESLKSNKALNEGFSSWKEQNAPTFPLEKFQSNTIGFISLMAKYVERHYINSLEYIININDNIMPLGSITTNGKNMIAIGVETLKKRCTKGEDQFNRALFKTGFSIKIIQDSDLGRFIASTLNAGSHKINDLDDVIEFLGEH